MIKNNQTNAFDSKYESPVCNAISIKVEGCIAASNSTTGTISSLTESDEGIY